MRGSQGKCRARFLWASGYNIFVNQSVHNLVLYLFMFTATLFNIYCWLINIDLMANSSITLAWMKLIWHVFQKAHHNLPSLDSILTLWVRLWRPLGEGAKQRTWQSNHLVLDFTFSRLVNMKLFREIDSLSMPTTKNHSAELRTRPWIQVSSPG